MGNNTLGIDNLKIEDLVIKVSDGENNDEVEVSFLGSFQSSYLEESMESYLLEIHEAVMQKDKKKVIVNFEKLTYIDSRSLGMIISWFKKVNEEDSQNQYKIDIYFNKDLMVHQTSFSMISELFPTIITIKTEFTI